MRGIKIGFVAGLLCFSYGNPLAWAQADRDGGLDLASAIAKQSDASELFYRVDWGALALAELRVSVSKDQDRRVLVTKGETLGVLSLFSDWSFFQAMAAEGDRRAVFSTRSFKGGDPYADFKVVWAQGRLPQVSGELGVQEDEDLTPIPEGELRDTRSPYQSIFQLAEKLARDQSCALTQRIFDGVRRYDVIVRDEGRETLDADRDWTYGGPAIKCRLIFKQIGGFSREPSSWSTEEEQMERFLWLARLRDDLWIPVRLKVSSALGYATGRLVTDRQALAAADTAKSDNWFRFGQRDK